MITMSKRVNVAVSRIAAAFGSYGEAQKGLEKELSGIKAAGEEFLLALSRPSAPLLEGAALIMEGQARLITGLTRSVQAVRMALPAMTEALNAQQDRVGAATSEEMVQATQALSAAKKKQ